MLEISTTKKFEKDIELVRKRGKDMAKLGKIIQQLSEEKTLDPKFRHHKLKGGYNGRWECHIEPDWLLVYCKTKIKLILERTGSHSDLFR